MTTNTQEIITSFDALPEAAKLEVAAAILRRTREFNFPPLTDDELVTNAESLFLEYDQRESSKEPEA